MKSKRRVEGHRKEAGWNRAGAGRRRELDAALLRPSQEATIRRTEAGPLSSPVNSLDVRRLSPLSCGWSGTPQELGCAVPRGFCVRVVALSGTLRGGSILRLSDGRHHVWTSHLRGARRAGVCTRAARMRWRRTDAGSSLGSWGTSLPSKAFLRIAWRRVTARA